MLGRLGPCLAAEFTLFNRLTVWNRGIIRPAIQSREFTFSPQSARVNMANSGWTGGPSCCVMIGLLNYTDIHHIIGDGCISGMWVACCITN